MTDRELLELAAKAAGLPIYESTDGTIQNRPIWAIQCGGGMGTMPYEEEWNPLRDDATALRLAVKLQIDVLQNPISKTVCCCGTDEQECEVFEEYGTDPYAATRRAIVRAAACIGKGME